MKRREKKGPLNASTQATEWAAKRKAAAEKAKALRAEREGVVPEEERMLQAEMRSIALQQTKSWMLPKRDRRPAQTFEERRRMDMHNKLITSAKSRVSTKRKPTGRGLVVTKPQGPSLGSDRVRMVDGGDVKLNDALDEIGSFFFTGGSEASSSPGSASVKSRPQSARSRPSSANTVQFYNIDSVAEEGQEVPQEEQKHTDRRSNSNSPDVCPSPSYPGQRMHSAKPKPAPSASEPASKSPGKWGLELLVNTQAREVKASENPPQSPAQRIQASRELSSEVQKPERSMRESLEALHDALAEACCSDDDEYDGASDAGSEDTFASDEGGEEVVPGAPEQPEAAQKDQGYDFANPRKVDPKDAHASWEGSYFNHLEQAQQGVNEHEPSFEEQMNQAEESVAAGSLSDLELLNRTSEMISALAKKTDSGTPQARKLGSAQQLIAGLDKGVRKGEVPSFDSISNANNTKLKGFQFGIDVPDWMADLGWAAPAEIERAEYQPNLKSPAQRITAAKKSAHWASGALSPTSPVLFGSGVTSGDLAAVRTDSSSPLVIRAPPAPKRTAAQIREELHNVIRAPSRPASGSSQPQVAGAGACAAKELTKRNNTEQASLKQDSEDDDDDAYGDDDDFCSDNDNN